MRNIRRTLTFALSLTLLSCNILPNTTINGIGTGNVVINIYNPSKFVNNSFFKKFRIKSIEPTDVFYANLSISGAGISSPITNATSPANPLRLPNGESTTSVSVTANSIPAGNNRIIKVEGLDKSQSSLGTPVTIMGVTNIIADNTGNVNVSWQTTPTAKVIEKLIALDSSFTSTVDATALQNKVDLIINNNTLNDSSDDIHPSLVNTDQLATYINSNSGNLPGLSSSSEINTYKLTTQTISGNISGITYSIVGVSQSAVKHIPPTTVYCNDSASNPVTVTDTDGNYTITGVTPGTGYTVKVVPSYHTEVSLSNVSSGSTGVNLTTSKINYLQHSINATNGVRHFKTSRAINVQIIVPNATRATTISYSTSGFRTPVIEALNMWEKLASDVISFNILADIFDNDVNLQQKKTDADIYIEWTNNLSGSTVGVATPFPDVASTALPPATTSFSVNYAAMPYNSTLRVSVTLATHDSSNDLIPVKSAREIALHELGHAMGIAVVDPGTGNAHPQTDISDIMYPSTNFSQPTNLNIGTRDLNTLRFLYNLPPNITRN